MFSTTETPYRNGDSSEALEIRRYADFYERFFQLNDEVFAGKHPRIKLPNYVLEQLALAPTNNASSAKVSINGTPNGTVQPLNKTSSTDPPSFTHSPYDPYPAQAAASKQSSAIDPVLLTKSDQLVKAELQLKRQRIESDLQHQAEARKPQTRDKEFGIDAESGFDLDEILAKATDIVKPISGLTTVANGNSPSSDSFDENSYYSSQANSWSSEDTTDVHNFDHTDTVEAASKEGATGDELSPSKVAAEQQELQVPNSTTQSAPIHQLNDSYAEADDDDFYAPPEPPGPQIREESDEYSPPPAADAGADLASELPVTQYSFVDPNVSQRSHGRGGRKHGDNGNTLGNTHVQSSPAGAGRTRGGNGGRQTDKPGPSRRASPDLYRPGQQDSAQRASPRDAGQQSPAGPSGPLQNPKKRRRDADNGGKSRRASGKRVARSPEPYIKPEPLSPPPAFLDYPDIQPQKRRAIAQLHDDVQIISPREMRIRPAYYREADVTPVSYRYEIQDPQTPLTMRAPPQAVYRRLERDDQDLRRVASLQYARRPLSPGPQPMAMPGSEPRSIRAASHAYFDRPATQQALYREMSVRPIEGERLVRAHSRSPLRPYTPSAMPPPPPKDYVIDEYGRKFYAVDTALARPRESAVPASRQVTAEPYFERPLAREPTVRQPVRVVDAYDEDIVQRMPPPPPRRFIEQPEVEYIEDRAYRERGYSQRPTEMIAPLERRPQPHYEEMLPPPREYTSRAYSVRPEVVRREPPIEYIARHESLQPGHQPGREYIRRIEQPPQAYEQIGVQPGEYAPADDHRFLYSAAPPPMRRYADEVPLGEPPIDPYNEELRRVGYRY